MAQDVLLILHQTALRVTTATMVQEMMYAMAAARAQAPLIIAPHLQLVSQATLQMAQIVFPITHSSVLRVTMAIVLQTWTYVMAAEPV